MTKKLIVFDLDGTLAPSKSSIDKEMAVVLQSLLEVAKVCIMSGGDWPQFEKQVLRHLKHRSKLENLFILPTCGTKFYENRGEWKQLYAENFTDDERKKILDALHQANQESNLGIKKTWGDQIEDRGSQITFSALGQEAPLDEKSKWDPDFAKRKKMKVLLDKLLKGFSVRLGGTTSVDITRPGIDKAYGIKKLKEVLHIDLDEMLFVGDALFPGGNDYPAEEAGVYSVKVRDPEDSKRVIEAIVGCLGGAQTITLENTASK